MYTRPLISRGSIHLIFSSYTLSGLLLFVSSISLSSFAFGFSNKVTDNIEPIVSVEWLLRHNIRNYLLIDVRDEKKYRQGHIENAIHIPIEKTFNQAGNTTRIAPIYQVQNFLSAAGVKNSDIIIVYDNGGLKNAAHLFWLLETYSHEKVTVLDGGFPAWVKNKGNISIKARRLPVSKYIASIATNSLATKLSTRLAIENTNSLILDSRSHDEYIGLKSKASRKGHVPNAINIPWSDNFSANENIESVRPVNELEELYNTVDKSKDIIAYCNRGKQSAVTYLVLRNMGYKVSIYDGGWLEWGNDPVLPVDTIK